MTKSQSGESLILQNFPWIKLVNPILKDIIAIEGDMKGFTEKICGGDGGN